MKKKENMKIEKIEETNRTSSWKAEIMKWKLQSIIENRKIIGRNPAEIC